MLPRISKLTLSISRSSAVLQLGIRCLHTTTANFNLSTALHFDPTPALDSTGKIPTKPYDSRPLPGTAPFYKTHLIISPSTTSSNSRPEITWPSHLASVSPLLAELESRAKKGGSLEGFGIAFSEGFEGTGTGAEGDFKEWDPKTSKFSRPIPNTSSESELFDIRIYREGGLSTILPSISLLNLDLDPLSSKPQSFASKIESSLSSTPIPSVKSSFKPETHIYLCTHSSRDCRCGLLGPIIIKALKKEIKEKGIENVKVSSVSHVGGHVWAANALVYPHGDWYGNLRESDVPLLLRAALSPQTSHHDVQDLRERSVHWSRWRGRLGFQDFEAREHYDNWGPVGLVGVAEVIPKARGVASTSTSTAPSTIPSNSISPSNTTTEDQSPQSLSKEDSTTSSQESTPLTFHSHSGQIFKVTGKLGESLKDVAKRNDLPSIEATCGGELECATCQAYLIPTSEGEAIDQKVLPEAKEEELDMLDYAVERKSTSRLICQIKVTKELGEWLQSGKGKIQLPRF